MVDKFQDPLSGKTKILEETLAKIRDWTGLKITVDARDLLIATNQKVNAIIRISVGKLEFPLFAVIKNRVSTSEQTSEIVSMKRFAGACLLARQIEPKICDLLRKAEIAYADLTENLYLPIVVDQSKSQKVPEQNKKEKSDVKYRPRIDTRSVMELLFYFLTDPKTLGYPQRKLAEMIGISAAAVNKAITSLENMNYLAQYEDGRKILRRKPELIKRWCIAYTDRFRQQIFQGKYRRLHQPNLKLWLKEVHLDGLSAVWGGEPAASQYTKHLDPEFVTIYHRGDLQTLLSRLRLTPSEDGDVELLTAFWPDGLNQEDLAPPLIVYADLIGSGFQRNHEIAGLINEQFKLSD
jgi:hypothetical protein